MSLDVTVTDLFCGAGGSSIGAEAAGARLRMAANHWSMAIETHAGNFPNADHDCADVSQVDPRRYPTTDVLIASPECTNHSQAKSNRHDANLFDPVGDPGAERSRSTMWDVPRFAERHRYQIVVVENVVEVRRWAPYSAWLAAMEALGYRHKACYLNSLIAHPTPQSRDRIYIVFWRDGNRVPDLDFRPRSFCQTHGDVEAAQRWKNEGKPGGKFRQQYLYRCPRCHEIAAPYAWPAASAIDWALPAQRIGDRVKPLAEATMRRIRVGLERYGSAIVQKSGHTYEAGGYVRAWPVDGPLPTQTTETHHALACPPFMLSQYDYKGGDQRRVYGVDEPLRTVVADGNHHGLVVPTHHGGDGLRARPTSEPWPTQSGRQENGVAFLPFIAELRGGSSDARGVDEPLSTLTASGNHHALIVKNYGDGGDPSMTKPITSPFGTVTTQDHHSLLSLPFLTSYYGNGGASPVDEPVPTVTTHDRHGLVEPTAVDVEDCGFRMLEPHEIGRAMAFPDSYVVVGNKRQRVRQYGNAVTPPIMSMILERAIGSLKGDGAE